MNPSFPTAFAKDVPTTEKLYLFAIAAVERDPVAIHPLQSAREKRTRPVCLLAIYILILATVEYFQANWACRGLVVALHESSFLFFEPI